MNLSAISHRPSRDYIYPRSEHELALQLVTAREDARKVTLFYWERGENNPQKRIQLPLHVSLRDAYHDYYRVSIHTLPIAAYIRYCFRLENNSECVWYGSWGFSTQEPATEDNFFEFLWPNLDDCYRAPVWAANQVYYQIFPERFCNGDESLSPKGVEPWGSTPTRENYMGGDLRGVLAKLDHIQQLGATCIYTTPIFYAASNHKYDTVDYYQIDPMFGTKEDLHNLVQEVHKRGMKILLDGVFNHCGYYWDKFQDVVKNGQSSPYCNWFYIRSYPVDLQQRNYECVGHYKWMPKINLANPDARLYFIEVGAYWLREFDIDGWRLDVADEVPMSFWEEFSCEMKRVRPDCLLLGECWGDAQRLLMENRLDSAMNYLFRDAVKLWLAQQKIRPSGVDHLLQHALACYPTETALCLYNPLDSHDTARFLYECKGDVNRFRLAVALQMTFPGCPAVFYGDEIGMSGDNDPGCRVAMEWDAAKQNRELFQWYKKLIAIRHDSPSLQKGDYHAVLCDDASNLYGFCRSVTEETTLVLINAGERSCTKEIEILCTQPVWQDTLAGKALTAVPKQAHTGQQTKWVGCINTELPAYSVRIYQQTQKGKV